MPKTQTPLSVDQKEAREAIERLTQEWLSKGNQVQVEPTLKSTTISESEIISQYGVTKEWLRNRIVNQKFVPSTTGEPRNKVNSDLIFNALDVSRYMKSRKSPIVFKGSKVEFKNEPAD